MGGHGRRPGAKAGATLAPPKRDRNGGNGREAAGTNLALAVRHAAMQHCGMTLTLPISKRGGLTLPPSLRRKLGLDGIDSPLVIVEERDGGLFLQAAAAVPVRDIPREKLARWIARDEAEMAAFVGKPKAKSKK